MFSPFFSVFDNKQRLLIDLSTEVVNHVHWLSKTVAAKNPSVKNSSSNEMELLHLSACVLILLSSWTRCESLIEERSYSLLCDSLRDLYQIRKLSKIYTIDIISDYRGLRSIEAFDCLKQLIGKNSRSSYSSYTTMSSFRQFAFKYTDQRKKNQVVMILDSPESLSISLQNMTANHYNFHGDYLIILTQKQTDGLDVMFDLLWRRFIYNVNIIVELDNSVKMFTFFPFSRRRKCHDTESVEINEYINTTWINNLFYPPKLNNMFRCKLKAACYEYGPAAHQTIHPNGSISLSGSDIEILRGLSEGLNAELQVEILTEIGSWGQVWENGSSIGAFNSVIEGKIDICANFYYLTELRSKFMQFTRAYYSVSMMMMIPRGAPFSALQKLHRPFQPLVWGFFCFFLFLAFVTVAIIKCQSLRIQRLFFDCNINAAVMEMLVILFGGSQHMLPKKSFSRILLMSFAMFCFVFRTIYTGSLFKFLQVGFILKSFVSNVSF